MAVERKDAVDLANSTSTTIAFSRDFLITDRYQVINSIICYDDRIGVHSSTTVLLVVKAY
jgi:hypothetical protein